MIGDRIDVNISGGLDVPLPRMARVRQLFDTTHLEDISGTVARELQRPEIKSKIKPGMSIAIGCGSRGVYNIAETAKAVVEQVKALGGKPFIFPAMGSHGGGTAEAQQALLEGYGITEAYTGAPIRSSMETVELGSLPNGVALYADKNAAEADGIILINRIKPHTNFRAPIESGIVKMLTIGMGKIKGATSIHTQGMDSFGELLPVSARFIMAKLPFLFGVGLVENAHDDTAIIEALSAEKLIAEEPRLQAKSKELIGRLQFDKIDVLIVDEIGKNISGSGMDPNITGRNTRGIEWDMKPLVQKIVILGLTPETHGNATGMGAADLITMRVFKELDIGPTYANVITATYLDGAVIPMIMNTEQECIQLAVKSVVRTKPADTRIVRIRNTLEVAEILVSEPMLEEVKAHSNMELLSQPTPFTFDVDGNLQVA